MGSLASEIAIANLSLTGLGADNILALTEDSENARKVNAVFALSRDESLRAHPWNFATKRKNFNLLATPPLYEFANAFQIPTDVLRILDSETGKEFLTFEIEADQVLTNDDSFKCKCIVRITDTTKWDAAFVIVFAARLEAELAYAITDSRTVQADRWAVYLNKLRNTKSYNAQEGPMQELGADLWLSSRFAGSTMPLARP